MSTFLRGALRRWRIVLAAVLAIDMGCLTFGPMFFAYIADAVLTLMLACLLGLTALSITRQICQSNATRRPDYDAIARMERDVWGEAFEYTGAPRRFPIADPIDVAHATQALGPMPPGMTMAEFTEGMGRLTEAWKEYHRAPEYTCLRCGTSRPAGMGDCPECRRERDRRTVPSPADRDHCRMCEDRYRMQELARRTRSTTCPAGHRANSDGTCLMERLRKLMDARQQENR